MVYSHRTNLVPVWDAREVYYERLHLKHLIKVIFTTTTSNIQQSARISISDYLCHPFFKDEAWMSSYEDRLRTYSTLDRSLDAELEINVDEIFTNNFLDYVDARIRPYILQKTKTPGNRGRQTIGTKFIDLWMCIRIRKHHFDRDPDFVKDIMGDLPNEYFAYWAKTFPYFFLHLFKTTAYYRPNPNAPRMNALKRFKFFFPAHESFYEACYNEGL